MRIVSEAMTAVRSHEVVAVLTQFLLSIYPSWHRDLRIDYKAGISDCSNVIMSNGRGHILGKNRCGLCGLKGGIKLRCLDESCRGRGERRNPWFFHVTCARQAGLEVNHDDKVEEFPFYGKLYRLPSRPPPSMRSF
jgi:hypothetical protein